MKVLGFSSRLNISNDDDDDINNGKVRSKWRRRKFTRISLLPTLSKSSSKLNSKNTNNNSGNSPTSEKPALVAHSLEEPTTTNNNNNNNNKHGSSNRTSRSPPSSPPSALEERKRKEEREKEYRKVVQQLSQMVVTMDPMDVYTNFEFLCASSCPDCKICTCKTKSSSKQPSHQYVMKITELNRRKTVMNLESEMRLLYACNHENIVRMEAAYAHAKCIYVCFKRCKYGSLTNFFCSMNDLTITEEHIVFICKQVLHGLVYLHDRNILHLDIKSDNLLVDEDYRVLITDFGASVQLESQEDVFCQVRGTPYWIAPEVLAENPRFNSKADVWSFGILVYELMNNLFPPLYHITDHTEAMHIIRNSTSPPVLPNQQQWSSEAIHFLYSALTIDPSKRYSAKQLLDHPFLKKDVRDCSQLFTI